MRFGKKVVGSTLYARLNTDVLLTFNGRPVTRQALIEKHKCGNFAAAKRLARALDGEAGIDSHAKLMELAAQPGVGVTTLYVALCLMNAGDAGRVLAKLDVTLPTVAGRKKEAR